MAATACTAGDERLGVESYYNSVEFFYLYLKALTK